MVYVTLILRAAREKSARNLNVTTRVVIDFTDFKLYIKAVSLHKNPGMSTMEHELENTRTHTPSSYNTTSTRSKQYE